MVRASKSWKGHGKQGRWERAWKQGWWKIEIISATIPTLDLGQRPIIKLFTMNQLLTESSGVREKQRALPIRTGD